MEVAHRTIHDLSTEILVDILSRLHHLQLVRCRRVCKSLQTIIDKTTSLQYTIELSAAGYQRGEATGSAVDDLKSFRHIQRIYRNPELNLKGIRITVPKLSALGPYRWSHFRRARVFGDTMVLCLEDKPRTLALLQLGSQAPASCRLRTLTLGFDIIEYFVDPSKNLLIASSTTELHFLSLADGTVHTKVLERPEGSTTIPTHRTGSSQTLSVSVSGDWLLINCMKEPFVPTGFPKYFLYHWPSGKLAKEWNGLINDFRGCLAHGHVFMPNVMLHHDNSVTLSINIYRLPDEPFDGQDLVHLASYSFPDLFRQGSTYLYIDSDSLPSYYGNFKSSQAMLTVHIGVREGRLYIPTSLLLTEVVMSRSATDSLLRIPWQRWGPTSTRFTNNHWTRRHLAFGVSGLHLICEDAILDFNPYDIANDVYAPAVAHGRALRNTDANSLSGTICTQPTEFPSRANFKEAVVTRLPYRRTHLHIPRSNRDEELYCIEEEDGPKIVKVAFSLDRVSLHLYVYSL